LAPRSTRPKREATQQAAQHHVVEHVVALEHARAEQEAAGGQRQAVVAAIGRERGGEEEQHLPESERDHDEVDALRPHRDRAGDEGEQRRAAERHEELDEPVLDPVACQDPYRIGADAEERRVAEGDQRPVAEDEIEGHRRDGEDHHPREERQDVALRSLRRHDGREGESGEDEERHAEAAK